MGNQTVAFLLNDLASTLEKSPKTVAYALANPPAGDDAQALRWWRLCLDQVAEENGEPRLHSQALEVLPSFHADDCRVFLFGHNTVVPLRVVSTTVDTDGRRLFTFEMPPWAFAGVKCDRVARSQGSDKKRPVSCRLTNAQRRILAEMKQAGGKFYLSQVNGGALVRETKRRTLWRLSDLNAVRCLSSDVYELTDEGKELSKGK